MQPRGPDCAPGAQYLHSGDKQGLLPNPSGHLPAPHLSIPLKLCLTVSSTDGMQCWHAGMTENRQKARSTTPACRQHSQLQVGDNECTTSSVLERTAVGPQEAASSRTQEGREPVWLSGYQGIRLLRGWLRQGLTSCKHTGVSSLGKP